jgi:hypothetical protein
MLKILMIIATSLLFFACSNEGTLKIINQTENEIYFSIDGGDYLISGSTDPQNHPSKSVNLYTGSALLTKPQKSYYLALTGETFAIYDENQQYCVPGTTISIIAGDTYYAYCNPNFACLRITNASSDYIIAAQYKKSIDENSVPITEAENLPPGNSIFKHLDYALKIPNNPEDIFYYTFTIVMDDDTVYNYGDEYNILYLDDLFHIVIE